MLDGLKREFANISAGGRHEDLHTAPLRALNEGTSTAACRVVELRPPIDLVKRKLHDLLSDRDLVDDVAPAS